MRAIILAASIVAMATSAQAQTTIPGDYTTSAVVTVTGCVEQFKGMPALAARLPLKEGGTGDGFNVRMCNGQIYDLMAIINAVLDRLDKADRK